MWFRLALSGVVLVGALLLLPQFKSDYVQSYAAARSWWQGGDTNAQTAAVLAECCPELAQGYPDMQTAHPPFATLLALPLGWLPWETARIGWLLVSWLAITTAWLIGQINLWDCAATAVFWILALGLGTHEPLLFLLLALALWLTSKERATSNTTQTPPNPRAVPAFIIHHASFIAGVLVGLCAAIKAYPALLLIGLWISGRRTMTAVAAATGVVATLICEFVLGFGVTLGWLAWTPVNTLRYVDSVENNSLVRLIRVIVPEAPVAVIALMLLALLLLPLLRHIRQGEWLRPLLPVILLVSPLSWRHYLGLTALGQITPFERICLALAGVAALLVGMQLVSADNMAPIVQGPLLLALLLMWYRWVSPAHARLKRNKMSVDTQR